MQDIPRHANPQVETPAAWHSLTVDEVERQLGTALAHGLSDAEARTRLERYGPMRSPSAPGAAARRSSSSS